MPSQGSPEPHKEHASDARKPEGKRAPTFLHFLVYKTGDFDWNAKSSVQIRYSIVKSRSLLWPGLSIYPEYIIVPVDSEIKEILREI